MRRTAVCACVTVLVSSGLLALACGQQTQGGDPTSADAGADADPNADTAPGDAGSAPRDAGAGVDAYVRPECLPPDSGAGWLLRTDGTQIFRVDRAGRVHFGTSSEGAGDIPGCNAGAECLVTLNAAGELTKVTVVPPGPVRRTAWDAEGNAVTTFVTRDAVQLGRVSLPACPPGDACMAVLRVSSEGEALEGSRLRLHVEAGTPQLFPTELAVSPERSVLAGHGPGELSLLPSGGTETRLGVVAWKFILVIPRGTLRPALLTPSSTSVSPAPATIAVGGQTYITAGGIWSGGPDQPFGGLTSAPVSGTTSDDGFDALIAASAGADTPAAAVVDSLLPHTVAADLARDRVYLGGVTRRPQQGGPRATNNTGLLVGFDARLTERWRLQVSDATTSHNSVVRALTVMADGDLIAAGEYGPGAGLLGTTALPATAFVSPFFARIGPDGVVRGVRAYPHLHAQATGVQLLDANRLVAVGAFKGRADFGYCSVLSANGGADSTGYVWALPLP